MTYGEARTLCLCLVCLAGGLLLLPDVSCDLLAPFFTATRGKEKRRKNSSHHERAGPPSGSCADRGRSSQFERHSGRLGFVLCSAASVTVTRPLYCLIPPPREAPGGGGEATVGGRGRTVSKPATVGRRGTHEGMPIHDIRADSRVRGGDPLSQTFCEVSCLGKAGGRWLGRRGWPPDGLLVTRAVVGRAEQQLRDPGGRTPRSDFSFPTRSGRRGVRTVTVKPAADQQRHRWASRDPSAGHGRIVGQMLTVEREGERERCGGAATHLRWRYARRVSCPYRCGGTSSSSRNRSRSRGTMGKRPVSQGMSAGWRYWTRRSAEHEGRNGPWRRLRTHWLAAGGGNGSSG